MTQILSIKSNKPEKTVNVTDFAAQKIGELIAAEGDPGLALRMAVRPGGCSGFSYEMYFDSQIDATDIVEEFGEVKVVVDPQSAELVKGSTLDYKDGLQCDTLRAMGAEVILGGVRLKKSPPLLE